MLGFMEMVMEILVMKNHISETLCNHTDKNIFDISY